MITSQIGCAQIRSIQMVQGKTLREVAENYGSARYLLLDASWRVFESRGKVEDCLLLGLFSEGVWNPCDDEMFWLTMWISACLKALEELMHQKVDALAGDK